MEVLTSRVLIRPADFERSRRWWTEILGLRLAREFGAEGRVTGVVLFCGGGFLELSGSGGRAGPDIAVWMQVPDVDAEHERLLATAEVEVVQPPETKPWGLRECWIADPDGVRIALVEVPEGHPLRTRLSIDRPDA